MSLLAIILFIERIFNKNLINSYAKARKEDYIWLKTMSINCVDIIKRDYIARDDFESAKRCNDIIEAIKEQTTKSNKNG